MRKDGTIMLYSDLAEYMDMTYANPCDTGIVLGVAEDLRDPKAGPIRCNMVKDPTDNVVRLHITKWGEKYWEVILPFSALETLSTDEKCFIRVNPGYEYLVPTDTIVGFVKERIRILGYKHSLECFTPQEYFEEGIWVLMENIKRDYWESPFNRKM